MKILAVTNMFPTPGNPRSGTFVEQQIAGLRNVGQSVDVVHVDRVQCGMASYARVKGLIRDRKKRFKPDVVHVMYGGVMAWLALQETKSLPTVVAFCGTDLNGEDTGSLALRLRGYTGVFCSHKAARRADQIIVKSRSLERRLPQDIDRERVTIIPNGVDLEVFKPMDRQQCRRQLGWSPDGFQVLFASHGPRDTNKRQPLAESATKMLNNMGIHARLQVMHNTPHDQVPLWLNAADAVVMTSVYEGSPNIVKEALACQRPVVSVDVGDVKERISEIKGCFIAEANPEDIADKLLMVAKGPGFVDSREKMKALSIERIALRLKDVYEETIRAFHKKGMN